MQEVGGAAKRTPWADMAVTLIGGRAGGPILARRSPTKPMEKFVIEGGAPLSGTLVPAGNKNGALPILACAILTEEEIVVRNVPRIRDVDAMLAILEGVGVRIERRGPHEVALC